MPMGPQLKTPSAAYDSKVLQQQLADH